MININYKIRDQIEEETWDQVREQTKQQLRDPIWWMSRGRIKQQVGYHIEDQLQEISK